MQRFDVQRTPGNFVSLSASPGNCELHWVEDGCFLCSLFGAGNLAQWRPLYNRHNRRNRCRIHFGWDRQSIKKRKTRATSERQLRSSTPATILSDKISFPVCLILYKITGTNTIPRIATIANEMYRYAE